MIDFIIHLLIIACIYIILVAGFNFSVGWGGILNLGHIGLFAIGAYTAALLAASGSPFPAALVAGGLVAGAIGALLAFLTKRISGDYLALATLGFTFMVYSFMLNAKDITGGALGVVGISRPEIFGISFVDNSSFFVLCFAITALLLFALWLITRSPFGKAMEALRDNPVMAKALGKDIIRLQLSNLAIAGFSAGIAGGLFAHYFNYIHPSNFSLPMIILALVALIAGGLASLPGSVLGVLLLSLLQEPVRFLQLPMELSELIGPLRNIFFGAILLLIIYRFPKGIRGRVSL